MIVLAHPEPSSVRPRPPLTADLVSEAAAADDEQQRRARLLIALCLTSAALHLLIIGVHAVLGGLDARALVPRLTMDVALVSAPLVVRWTGSVRLASLLVGVVGALALPAIALQSGGLAAPMVVAWPLALVLFSSFVGRRGVVFLGLALLAGIGLVGWLGPGGGSADALVRAVVAASCVVAAALAASLRERERVARDEQLRELAAQLHRASVRDGLTRVYNQAYLTERLANELAFSVRHGVDLSVLMIDVDHFKRVNDVHGHAAGDDVLAELAGRLLGCVRAEDVVARYGGEEFIVLLRATAQGAAAVVAERIRQTIEATAFSSGAQTIPVTISLGCASVAATGATRSRELLAAADQRLYAAKGAGRNCVVASAPPPAPRPALVA